MGRIPRHKHKKEASQRVKKKLKVMIGLKDSYLGTSE